MKKMTMHFIRLLCGKKTTYLVWILKVLNDRRWPFFNRISLKDFLNPDAEFSLISSNIFSSNIFSLSSLCKLFWVVAMFVKFLMWKLRCRTHFSSSNTKTTYETMMTWLFCSDYCSKGHLIMMQGGLSPILETSKRYHTKTVVIPIPI